MTSMIHRLSSLYRLEIRATGYVQHLFLLVIRLYWGWQFFLTGRGKLMNIERTAEFFTSLGIPMPTLNAYAAGTTECLGGLLLLAGIASRVTSIPLVVTMCVAYATAHTAELQSILSNTDAFVTAPPFLFLLASLIVLLFGPGKLSVDGIVESRLKQKAPAASDAATRSGQLTLAAT